MLDPENSLHTRQSLYTRLGGYDALAAFVRELMPRLHNDPELGIYWKGKSLELAPQGGQASRRLSVRGVRRAGRIFRSGHENFA